MKPPAPSFASTDASRGEAPHHARATPGAAQGAEPASLQGPPAPTMPARAIKLILGLVGGATIGGMVFGAVISALVVSPATGGPTIGLGEFDTGALLASMSCAAALLALADLLRRAHGR